MKNFIKYFMFSMTLLLFSALTSCDTAESSLKRAIENGEYQLVDPLSYSLEMIDEAGADHYYVLLEDVKATKIEAKKGDPEIFGYMFLQMKFQYPETGDVFEAYAYYKNLAFAGDVEKAKKGQKIYILFEKDNKGRYRVLDASMR